MQKHYLIIINICPKKPPEVVKDVKEDIEDIVVNKNKNLY